MWIRTILGLELALKGFRVLQLGLVVMLGSPLAVTASVQLSVPQQGYRLGANDVIRIQVFGEEDLTVEGRVGGDGKINFPLLGALEVGGRTVQELREELTARLAGGYVRQPKVTVYIVRYRNFYVSGEVKNPGGYSYEEGLTIQKAISIAGGFTEKSDRKVIRLARGSQGIAEAQPAEPDALVFPDDTIVVAQIRKFYVTGEVERPGGYPFEDGLTVQKAISIGGGLTDKAERQAIRVTRIVDGLAEMNLADPDAVVLPDDIIVVEPQTYKIYVSGEVKNPGGYPYKDSLTVHKAIAMAGGLTEKAERGEFRLLRHSNGHEETLPVRLETLVLPDDIIVVAEGQRFYVSGEVKTPGRYLFEKGLTVHKAISMAGGMTDKAEKRDIKITRVVGDLPQTAAAELETSVLPDDFIVIERIQKVYVNGEVKKPGDYPYEKGLTVHKVITMAGGFTDKAADGRTRVLRMVNGQEQSTRVKLEELVLPEDIIVVPKRFF